MNYQAETNARLASHRTFSLTSSALYAILASAYAAATPLDELAQSPLLVEVHSQSLSSTSGSTELVPEDIDAALGRELERVTYDLASAQVELDKDSRRVLYTRMRELYLR